MALRDDIPALVEHIKANQCILDHNFKLFDIYEGNLLKYVEQDLARQLSPQSFEQARHRICLLNILRQLMDKLSRIYPPTRRVIDGADQDGELLAWYEDTLNANQICNQANEFFNLFKSSLLEPYIWNGRPYLRAIPSDRFLPYTADRVNPTVPTHFIIAMGDRRVEIANPRSGAIEYSVRTIYFAYTAQEWIVFDSDGMIRPEIMFEYGNPEGINPYGVLPFVYINRSRNLLIPKPDSDLYVMARLPSILATDQNFCAMFQSFSIVYGIDVDDENVRMAPNAFWSFRSDPNSEKTPQVNVLKPEGDIDQLTRLIQNTLAMWAQTRGIKVNFAGNMNGQDIQSGVAKLIDELDTWQDREKQTAFFIDAEQQLWNLILKDMHPVWQQAGMIDTALPAFNPNADIEVNFAEQIPLISRGDLVEDLQAEVAAGFITRRRAIKKLNPRMSDEEIDDLLAEMDEERAPMLPPADDNMGDDDDGTRED